jgi:hypothetical protein
MRIILQGLEGVALPADLCEVVGRCEEPGREARGALLLLGDASQVVTETLVPLVHVLRGPQQRVTARRLRERESSE